MCHVLYALLSANSLQISIQDLNTEYMLIEFKFEFKTELGKFELRLTSLFSVVKFFTFVLNFCN